MGRAKSVLPKIKIYRPRRLKLDLPAGPKPEIAKEEGGELLTGVIQGKKASAPEERFGKEAQTAPQVELFEFRRPIYAPGFYKKELDGLLVIRGIAYAVEVDSEFTHRNKGESDRLHDAIVLKSLEQEGYDVYPNVIHLDMETDLVDQAAAKQTFKRYFS